MPVPSLVAVRVMVVTLGVITCAGQSLTHPAGSEMRSMTTQGPPKLPGGALCPSCAGCAGIMGRRK